MVFVCCGSRAYGSAALDLYSPLQAKRDSAAALLRPTYIPSPKSSWNSVTSFVSTNHNRKDILKRLSSFRRTTDGSLEHYRLDSSWELTCNYRINSKGTNEYTLKGWWLSLRHCWVAPPPKFTGPWVTYYVNGQKCWESLYKDGDLVEWLEYEDDGSKDMGHIYHRAGPIYEQEVMYDRSGRTNACFYIGADEAIQATVSYNKDGTTVTNWSKDGVRK